MDLQGLAVLVVVVAAGCYVARTLLPRKSEPKGCSSCPQNPRRRDDYT
jgi:hypothetical protein